MKKRILMTLSVLLTSAVMLLAQRTISGTVTSDKGESLIGASVVLKGSTKGAITDLDGKYSLSVDAGASTLVFSFTGYETKEVAIGASDVVDVVLSEGALLQETVVTAFGVKKDKSNLGYTVGQLTGDELTTGRTTNVTNALAGKVAGVRISGSGGSFTGSGITIRGATTFLGSNQPLFVVDGIPIDNSGGSQLLQSGPAVSNRAIDLNQEDIEDISVLQGPGATTLYGSRGAAGVILITTKKGKSGKMSVTYTANYANQEVNRLPDYQNKYGQGSLGAFNPAGTASWGPNIDGRKVILPADFRTLGLGIGGSDSVALTAYPDNVKELFRTGYNMQHNIAFDGGVAEKSTYRLSVGYLEDQGVIENNKLKRYNVSFNSTNNLTKTFKVTSSLNYSLNKSKRTQQGNQLSNPFFRSWFTPRSYNLTGLPWTNAAGRQLHYDAVDNPRWTIANNLYDDQVDRILGNVGLNYRITDWLSVDYKVGADVFSLSRSFYDQIGARGGASTAAGGIGGIRERRDNVRNLNSYLTFNVTKDLSKDFTLNALIGQETIDEYRNNTDLIGRGVVVRDFRNIQNVTSYNINSNNLVNQKRLIGLFGNATVSYRNYATLDLSLRNDWNSTLLSAKNPQLKSYLYYSVAASTNLTEALKIKSDNVNLIKLRGNYGVVGKGGDFLYSTDTYFENASGAIADGFGPNITYPFNGLAAYTYGNTAGDPNLKPEFTTTAEFGIDLSFFKNRIKLEATRYRAKSTDIIFPVPNSAASGITARVTNAGSMTTNGLQALLTIVPVKTSWGSWTTSFNYTQYKSIVDELDPSIDNIFLGGFTTPNIRLVKGEEFGQIYGNAYQRNAAGQLLLTATGLPQATTNVQRIGNFNPRWTMGVQNTIEIKGFSLGFLLDIRKGGDQYSRNIADLQRNGVASETAEKERLNADGTVAKPYFYEGILPDGTVNSLTNKPVSAQDYWGNSGKYVAAEGFIYDISWFRIREASLSYNIPKGALSKIGVSALEVGVFGRNLFLSAPNYPHLDPEQNALGINNAQGLEFNALPQTRTVGMNVRVKF
ncbi:MAG: hypothetical protein RL757_444 [Bacteroidota bacterium]|jgi:TonB-linked SusC/RagA family outer membrane protein